jgi:hypothetical protein
MKGPLLDNKGIIVHKNSVVNISDGIFSTEKAPTGMLSVTYIIH